MTVHAETVLERVLLAIIEAHPSSDLKNRPVVRLQQAMAALLGTSPTQWEATDKAIAFMARERQQDICNADMSALAIGAGMVPVATRSVEDLADIAARSMLGLECRKETHGVADFLCLEYRRRAARHLGNSDPMFEAMQEESVQRILDELAEWDVPPIHQK